MSSSSAPGPAARPPRTTSPGTGCDVLLLEKTEFPREKVCGDGLTPRAVKQLIDDGHRHHRGQGLDAQPGPAGHRRRHPARARLARPRQLPRLRPDPHPAGLRRAAGRRAPTRPAPSCARARNVTGPVLDERPAGSSASTRDRARQGAAEFRAPLVIAADGVSGRFALALGIAKREDRPMGVAVRRYYRSPPPRRRLPGVVAGAAQPGGAATSCCPAMAGSSGSATAGSTSASACSTRQRGVRQDQLPHAARRLAGRHAGRVGPDRRGQRRRPSRRAPRCRWASTGCRTTPRGVMLVGDSGGMVNPFNGEGIAYAMESGALAAEVAVQALARPAGPGARAGAAALPGRAEGPLRRLLPARRLFVKLIGHPEVMRFATKHGHAAPDADAVRAEAARQPHRPAGRRRDGPRDQRDDPNGARGLT